MIAIWTLVAVVLHFIGLGAFADWPVIAGPFTWSCMCLLLWEVIAGAVFGALALLCTIIGWRL